MSRSVSLSDLHRMATADKERVLGDIIARAQAPSNGQRAAIELRVKEYEQRYEMTSEELREKLAADQLPETREFSQWLFWYNALHG